ncbi:unnamed protein product [Linum tenue]|uniref:Uncharacterized protein n=1 Tax=Linum tenue TaxID=586396 RepID=A0AAV0KQT1_9ROSI|nr:unnamed protein product [Linum tenue]
MFPVDPCPPHRRQDEAAILVPEHHSKSSSPFFNFASVDIQFQLPLVWFLPFGFLPGHPHLGSLESSCGIPPALGHRRMPTARKWLLLLTQYSPQSHQSTSP